MSPGDLHDTLIEGRPPVSPRAETGSFDDTASLPEVPPTPPAEHPLLSRVGRFLEPRWWFSTGARLIALLTAGRWASRIGALGRQLLSARRWRWVAATLLGLSLLLALVLGLSGQDHRRAASSAGQIAAPPVTAPPTTAAPPTPAARSRSPPPSPQPGLTAPPAAVGSPAPTPSCFGGHDQPTSEERSLRHPHQHGAACRAQKHPGHMEQ